MLLVCIRKGIQHKRICQFLLSIWRSMQKKNNSHSLVGIRLLFSTYQDGGTHSHLVSIDGWFQYMHPYFSVLNYEYNLIFWTIHRVLATERRSCVLLTLWSIQGSLALGQIELRTAFGWWWYWPMLSKAYQAVAGSFLSMEVCIGVSLCQVWWSKWFSADGVAASATIPSTSYCSFESSGKWLMTNLFIGSRAFLPFGSEEILAEASQERPH